MWLEWKDGELYLEGVPAREIAETYGTPVFVYSIDEIKRRIFSLERECEGFPHIICFSVKSNYNFAILKSIARWGFGADVVSAGELFLAKKAGFPSAKIVFAGVGKTQEEIKYAIEENILLFNVESEEEYNLIREIDPKAPISFRVKFQADLRTIHKHLQVGKEESKFGIPEKEAFSLYLKAKEDGANIKGIHFHIGSQILDVDVFKAVAQKAEQFIKGLESEGVSLDFVDVGGGLGIPYRDTDIAPSFAKYVQAFEPVISLGKTIIFEPGRSIVAPAGVLLTKVIRTKDYGKHYTIVDASMTEVIRPALYNAIHRVVPVIKDEKKEIQTTVVGPVCENADFIAKDVKLPNPQKGDLLAVLDVGAYCSSMSSNYNGRPKPPEVIVSKGKHYLARRREKFEELVMLDNLSLLFD